MDNYNIDKVEKLISDITYELYNLDMYIKKITSSLGKTKITGEQLEVLKYKLKDCYSFIRKTLSNNEDIYKKSYLLGEGFIPSIIETLEYSVFKVTLDENNISSYENIEYKICDKYRNNEEFMKYYTKLYREYKNIIYDMLCLKIQNNNEGYIFANII